MKMTVIPIVVGALGTLPKNQEKRLEEQIYVIIEIIQAETLKTSARIRRKVLETWGDLLSLRLQYKTTNYNAGKIFQRLK